MKFSSEVPEIAEASRPWARSVLIGPPPGEGDKIGSLMCQVDDSDTLGRRFRCYVDFEPGDIEKILRDGVLEFSVLSDLMVPVSVQILGGQGPAEAEEVVDRVTKTHYTLSWEAHYAMTEEWGSTSRQICVEEDGQEALDQMLAQARTLKGWQDSGEQPIRSVSLKKAKSMQEPWKECDIYATPEK